MRIRILSIVALALTLGGCLNGGLTLGQGISFGSGGYSAYYLCRQNRLGSSATEYHGLETRITNASSVPIRVSGGLLGGIEIPPGQSVTDCVVTAGRSQAVVYTAIATRPGRDGRYATDYRTLSTGFEYGSINRDSWSIRF